jgi:signal transduction histidine kinase
VSARAVPARAARRPARGGAVVVAAAVVAIAVGIGSIVIAARSPAWALAAGSGWASAAEVVAGWSLVAAGLALAGRREARTGGLLLVAAGLAWFVVDWNNPGIGSGALFTLGLVLWALCPAVVGHAALAHAGGARIGTAARIAIGAGYAGAIVGLGLLPALVFDPTTAVCGECPANLVGITGDPGAAETLGRIGLGFGVVWAAALAALTLRRLVSARPAVRRRLAPVLAPAAAYLLLVAVDFAHGVGRGFASNDPVDRRLWLGEALALVVLAAGVGWERVRGRRTRALVARAVVEHAAGPPPGGLREVLARLLGDPGLAIAYARDDGPGWIDAAGRPAAVPPGPGTTNLVAGGRSVAALVHRPGLLDDPALVREIAAAARLALEHERLNAQVTAQLERLRDSRARIVATGDAERRRLERDLHDGAQQRLVSLSIGLRLAGLRAARVDPALAAGIDAAEAEIVAALGELRELAHGIHPMALSAGGLAGAVEALAERTPRLVPGDLTEDRFAPDVESAAYFVVAEALRAAGPDPVAVDVRRDAGRVVVEVSRGATPDLTALEDRVGALDGTVALHDGPAGPRIRVEMPCA